MRLMSKLKSWRKLPIGGLLLEDRSSREYKTGDWRVFKPIIDKQKCIGCFLCWIYCPEPSIISLGLSLRLKLTMNTAKAAVFAQMSAL